MGVMEFGIVRNNIYRLSISKVAGLGSGDPYIEPEQPDEYKAELDIMELGRKLRLWALCLFLLHNIMEAGKLRLLSLFANIWSITRFVCRIYSGGVQACFRGPRLYDTEDTRKW